MTIAIKNNKTWNPGVEQLLVHNNPNLKREIWREVIKSLMNQS